MNIFYCLVSFQSFHNFARKETNGFTVAQSESSKARQGSKHDHRAAFCVIEFDDSRERDKTWQKREC